MNIKRFIAASAVVFLCFVAIDFVFDFLILGSFNNPIKNLMRQDMIRWMEPVLYLMTSLLFVLIFITAGGGRGAAKGVILGLLVGLLASGTLSFKQYAMYPVPFVLAILWFIEGLLQYVIAGIVAALMYRPKT
jgi:hypothetical protein